MMRTRIHACVDSLPLTAGSCTHSAQASAKKCSTQSMQPQLGKRKRGKPSNAERACAVRAAAAAAAEAPLP